MTTIGKKQLEVNVFLREASETVTTEAVLLQLTSDIVPQFQLPVLADTVPTLPFIKTYDPQDFQRDHPQHAGKQFADPANQEQVGLMLGNDYLWRLLRTETTMIPITNTLFLLNSVFGWLIVGSAPRNKFGHSKSFVCLSVQESISSLW